MNLASGNGGTSARNPIYIDRLERKYLIGIREDEMAGLWRDLKGFLEPHGLAPVQDITLVGSVYFDNKDYDLLRCILLIRRCHILVRLRAYESYGQSPEPISEYWIEVKNRNRDHRRKRRFRIKRATLRPFLDGDDVMERVLDDNREEADARAIGNLYAETRETFFTWGLKPCLLVTYKRVAFQNGGERLSVDWDIQYYPVTEDVYSYDTWKYPVEPPAGKAKQIILEFKYPHGTLPEWIEGLQRRYPIWESNYVKPVEGMGFLFEGPLSSHEEAGSFLRMIRAYTEDWKLALEKHE
ncbi:MAG: VTC domain-containing protein [Deltaproteobacteria bacterium]|nr:VTC domain-containing protein [Deltaproteobacteria bacterium]